MTQINRLLAVLLSAQLALPAAAAPVVASGAPHEGQPQAPAPVHQNLPPVTAIGGAPAIPAASIIDAYGQAPSAAAREAAAAAAVQKAAAPAASAEAGAEVTAEGLPQGVQTIVKEAKAAFGEKKAEAVGDAAAPAAAPSAQTLAAPTQAAAKPAAPPAAAPRRSLSAEEEAALNARRSQQGPIVKEVDGVERPFGYNPDMPITPLWKEMLSYVAHPIKRVQQILRYVGRVNEYMREVTDEDLAWSLKRFPEFEKQEGILRHSNREMVNDWKRWSGASLRQVTPEDYDDALMSRISIRKLFKQAMDREEPTLSYQATSAHELHDFMHNVAHFMGLTMQERVIAVALTGKAPQESVWAAEEKRHGQIMESVYNLSRPKGWPKLSEQGIAPTSPDGGEYEARSMIANRALAEIGAGTAYLLLKSNAKKGSPSDQALEGIFRDEVYHYVLMEAARKWGFGKPASSWERFTGMAGYFGRIAARKAGFKVEVRPLNQYWGLERLLNVVYHYNDNQLPTAVDTIVDERPGFSPLAVFQVAYAFLSIHRRVDQYLRTIPDEVGVRAIGQVYGSQAEFDAAVARGEHLRTDPYKVEQNPDLTTPEIRELVRRFPGRFSMERRSIKASQVRGIVERYRKFIENPSYWLRKKGFEDLTAKIGVAGPARLLVRELGGDTKVVAKFVEGRTPRLTVVIDGKVTFDKPFNEVSMRQFGVVFADYAPAEAKKGVEALAKINEVGADFSLEEIVKRLGNKKTYQDEPLTLIQD